MAQCANCPIPHDGANGLPTLGVSLLTPSPNPRPLLDLLGGNDQKLQEQMAEGHPYAFNMGSGNNISYQNYQEVPNVLMGRNLPDVLHNRQMEVVL